MLQLYCEYSLTYQGKPSLELPLCIHSAYVTVLVMAVAALSYLKQARKGLNGCRLADEFPRSP